MGLAHRSQCSTAISYGMLLLHLPGRPCAGYRHRKPLGCIWLLVQQPADLTADQYAALDKL
jgi:hypothetical protein